MSTDGAPLSTLLIMYVGVCDRQLSPDCKYLQTTVLFEVGPEMFSCTGKTLINPGYTSVMTWQQIAAEESMPQFTVGDVCSIHEVSQITIYLIARTIGYKNEYNNNNIIIIIDFIF